MLRVLSPLESRVLGVLVEKERTVPDSYPLTLNALVAGSGATMILLAFRHGLRGCSGQSI